ncbi:MAG TPA: nuclear transport factor 2 family protein [Solirubrobacteraceae bacterium]|nr:nuclear transport factor 2 family protein [Solirubrobacteraceae bacterium]
MSKVEYVTGLYASPDALFAAMHPQVVWIESAGVAYGGTYNGPEEVGEKVFARLGADWDGFRADPETVIEQGDVVVALGTYSGTSTATGRPFTARFTHWYWLDGDDRITRFEQVVDSATMNAASA